MTFRKWMTARKVTRDRSLALFFFNHKSDSNFDRAIYADRMPLYSVTIRLLQRRTNDLRRRLHR